MANFVFNILPQCLAGLLLQLATPSPFSWGRKNTVYLTHEQLASLAGATRDAVSEILSTFAQNRLIRQSCGKIILLSRERLMALREWC